MLVCIKEGEEGFGGKRAGGFRVFFCGGVVSRGE